MLNNDSIVALATPSGAGAIAIIRISGEEAITIGNSVFQSIKGKDLTKQKSHTLHLGHVIDNQKTLDEVLVSIFKGPNSYTGENTIEISCHGSTYIQQQISPAITWADIDWLASISPLPIMVKGIL